MWSAGVLAREVRKDAGETPALQEFTAAVTVTAYAVTECVVAVMACMTAVTEC